MISPVEGELRVRKDAELDRENIPFYNLTIAARDRGVPPLSSTVSPTARNRKQGWELVPRAHSSSPPPQMVVGVRVLDINDNDPVLLNLPMNLTLSEHAPVSSFVTRVLARDADKGPNALLTFDITAGNAESAFYINSTVRPAPAAGGQEVEGGHHVWAQLPSSPRALTCTPGRV